MNSAANSISQHIGISSTDIIGRLKEYSHNQFEDDCNSIRIEPTKILKRKILGEISIPAPDSIIWFHGTRVFKNCYFSEGILPLNVVLPRIELKIKELANEVGLSNESELCQKQIPKGSRFGYLYELKTADPQQWGPYAFLTRDALVPTQA